MLDGLGKGVGKGQDSHPEAGYRISSKLEVQYNAILRRECKDVVDLQTKVDECQDKDEGPPQSDLIQRSVQVLLTWRAYSSPEVSQIDWLTIFGKAVVYIRQ